MSLSPPSTQEDYFSLCHIGSRVIGSMCLPWHSDCALTDRRGLGDVLHLLITAGGSGFRAHGRSTVLGGRRPPEPPACRTAAHLAFMLWTWPIYPQKATRTPWHEPTGRSIKLSHHAGFCGLGEILAHPWTSMLLVCYAHHIFASRCEEQHLRGVSVRGRVMVSYYLEGVLV